METFSPAFNRLVSLIKRLPGIGEKSAERHAYHILKSPPQYAAQLAAELAGLHERIRFCSVCGLLTEQDPCPVCTSTRRDPAVLCVVEDPGDALRIEQTGEFRGRYHVLMGALSPLNRVHPENLRISELVERVRSGEVREVILATNPTVEGDTTALYVANCLKEFSLSVTRLAKGLPVGGDLELADTQTLARAMHGRDRI